MEDDSISPSLQLLNDLRIHDKDELASANTAYRHTPLSSPMGCFRLLKITERRSSTLSYSLEEFAFDSRPEYFALSYTWGAPVSDLDKTAQEKYDRREGTRCNDQSLLIGRNLYEALSHVSSTHPGAYLWADAICINQGDDSERGTQVAQMGDIYANAERVIVWLGESTLYPELDDFLWLQGDTFRDYLFELEKTSESERANDIAQGRTPLTAFIRFITGRDCPEGLNPRSRWQAYEDFYGRCRWWTRAWVVQEVTLAQDIETYCGAAKLNWDKLRSLSSLVQRHASTIRTCIRLFEEEAA